MASVELRRRTGAPTDANAASAVQPLESTEQERIIREFELDKMKQDSMWKHFLAILYGGTTLALTLVLACAVLFGCGARVTSPLDGPRCTYFALPTLLYELYDSFQASSSSLTPLLVHATLVFAIGLVTLWAYYSWRMDLVDTQQNFNDSRSRAKLTTTRPDDGEDESRSLTGRSIVTPTSPPPLPIAANTWKHLQMVQKIATGCLAVWLLYVITIVCLRYQTFGLLLPMFLCAPVCLASLTKLSAKWSNDLEEQIRDLKTSKYSYHEA